MKYIWTAANILSLALGLAAAPAPWPPTPSDIIWCKVFKLGAPIVAESPSTPIHGLQLSIDTATPTLVGKGFTGG
ncbi:hypothetical protein M407DRAFT_22594 [Tulasnella calospora MUT 4182]|uniref:Uncharacterized protein n=1 Tax=Tulasnella calospora MUT 4182 TaxID=1051891 RepID=A0A0C3QML2_9AGAM|nr:hypothetical protein M407DRAFT_22594 [Tulasnella calospora MUT 4182]